MFGSRKQAAQIAGLQATVLSQQEQINELSGVIKVQNDNNAAFAEGLNAAHERIDILQKGHRGFIKSVVTRLDAVESQMKYTVGNQVFDQHRRRVDDGFAEMRDRIRSTERYSPAAIAKEREMHGLTQLMLYPSKLWSNCDFAAAPGTDPTAQALKELRDATTLTVENEAGAAVHNVPLKAVVMQVLDFLKLKPQSVPAQRAGVKLVKVPAKKK